MISSESRGAWAGASVLASGRWRLISVSRRKLVDTMKNRTRTSSTSTSEITLISGSSLDRLCSFIRDSEDPRTLVLQQRVDEVDCLLLDQHDESLDAPAQVAVCDQRRNRDREAGRGRDQGFGDAAG